VTVFKRGLALICGAGLLLAACSSSKHTSTPSNSVGSSQTTGGQSGATIPPPAKITGTLSGPGVTPTTITIGQITTITGPVPGLFQGANDGLDAWAAWVNAHGGLDGRTVKIDHVDDGFNCTTYTNAMKQFSTSAFAVLGNLTLEDTCGKSVLAADPNLLDIQALALDPTLYTVPNVYTASPTPPGGITTGLQYIKNKFPNDITHAAALVGVSAKVNGKEEQLTAESIGYHYVYTRNIGDFETNYTSDILRMKNAGVKIVDLTAVAVTNNADFLQQAAQQNFHPDVVYGATAYDSKFFQLVGNASLANGIVFSALPDALYLGQDRATVPAVNTFLTWLDNARHGASANLFAVDAWAAGQLFVKAMQAAGSNITQASVAQGIKNVNSFNADGLIGVTNPGQKMGTSCVVIAGVENGQWKRLDPASTGFDCSGVYHPVSLSQAES
jgi:ABC-type branched-subunit amino acid transport system substrate-binding protein